MGEGWSNLGLFGSPLRWLSCGLGLLVENLTGHGAQALAEKSVHPLSTNAAGDVFLRQREWSSRDRRVSLSSPGSRGALARGGGGWIDVVFLGEIQSNLPSHGHAQEDPSVERQSP